LTVIKGYVIVCKEQCVIWNFLLCNVYQIEPFFSFLRGEEKFDPAWKFFFIFIPWIANIRLGLKLPTF